MRSSLTQTRSAVPADAQRPERRCRRALRLWRLAGWMAVAWTAPLTGSAQQHESTRLPVVPASNPEVLRQKVSVPLEALVEPFDLTEWVTVDPTLPPAQTEVVELKDNPFVDDPEPTEAKIPLGDLLGVFGRALRTSVPVPPWSAVRERMPALPVPVGNVGASVPRDRPEDGSDADFAPFAEDDDPFGVAPAQFESPLPETEEAADSSEDPPAAEDDPFAF